MVNLIGDLGYDEASDEVKVARENALKDEQITIETKKMKDGSYRSRVLVNGDFYAEARSNDREATLREANHYATQIEFDEWGNW